jgi:hypothetical protein
LRRSLHDRFGRWHDGYFFNANRFKRRQWNTLYQCKYGHKTKRQDGHEAHDVGLQISRTANVEVGRAIQRIGEW